MNQSAFEHLLALLSEERLRKSTLGTRGILIASESDKGRVINSASFRRLQQKAQVFPLEPNASVRTRLTHSIEVSQIGRHLAQKVIETFCNNSGSYDKLAAFVNTIETACLLHDIGNPPFGHLGESAIKEWFSDTSNNCQIPDFQSFDGNPQGFRMITFLAGQDHAGLNLTCAQLLSTIKYPWDLRGRPPGKKVGVFSAEWSNYLKACERVNWSPGKKFPFMRLMDCADEIAYSMSDLEDGLEKGIISDADLEAEFGQALFPKGVLKPFIAFKTNVINQAVSVATECFTKNIDGVLAGSDFDLIDKGSEIGDLLAKVSRFARSKIYSSNEAERIELAGRSVIKGLLRHFGELIKLSEEDFLLLARDDAKEIKRKGLDFQVRLFRWLPNSYREKYKYAIYAGEDYRRASLLIDFISGMTDDFALDTYQILEGIRIK